MSQNTHIQSKNLKKALKETFSNTPSIIVNAIAVQMDRSDEAKKRIEEEGIVVRDLRGSVIPHPAIKIEADATKLISELLIKSEKFQ